MVFSLVIKLSLIDLSYATFLLKKSKIDYLDDNLAKVNSNLTLSFLENLERPNCRLILFN